MKLSEMWSRTAVTRTHQAAVIGGVSAVVGGWAAGQPWVATSLAGTPACPAVTGGVSIDVATATGTVVSMPNVATCSTLWSEASAATAVAASQFTSTFGLGGVTSTVPLTGGMPSFVVWVFATAVLMSAGLLLRNALVVAPALLTWVWGYSAYNSSVQAMTTGLAAEQFSSQYGASVAWLALCALGAVAAASTVFVALTNKKLRRQRAEQDGREVWSLESIRDLSSAILRATTSKARE